MKQMVMPDKLIRLTWMTMSTTQAQSKMDNKLSTKFEFNVGVKQGDGLSVVLFIVALYSVIKTTDQRGIIFTKSSQICAYVDDIIIIARSREKIIDIYKKMQEKAGKIVLEVNERKTKYMIMSTYKTVEGSQRT
jgi:sorting nexin-29